MRSNVYICQLILLALAGVIYSNAAKSSESWQMQRVTRCGIQKPVR